MSLPLWCTAAGINYDTVVHRMKYRGWSVEEALFTPLRGKAKSKFYNVDGEVLTLTEAAAALCMGWGI